jgi:hypothetical protein
MPLQVTITRITETVGRAEAGKLIAMMRVEFLVGKHGPFAQEFPRETFNARDARTKLEGFARELEVLAPEH